jgi:hypothetical protein
MPRHSAGLLPTLLAQLFGNLTFGKSACSIPTVVGLRCPKRFSHALLHQPTQQGDGRIMAAMAKGTDQLIECVLSEIALCGVQGMSPCRRTPAHISVLDATDASPSLGDASIREHPVHSLRTGLLFKQYRLLEKYTHGHNQRVSQI